MVIRNVELCVARSDEVVRRRCKGLIESFPRVIGFEIAGIAAHGEPRGDVRIDLYAEVVAFVHVRRDAENALLARVAARKQVSDLFG